MPQNLLQNWLVPWSETAISLFNTVLLLWLGITVLLNSRGRTWGNYLAGFGLLLGGAFFLAHSAALDYSLEALLDGSPVWWMFVAIPLIALPFGWLILMLWSCGFWDEKTSRLARRARFPLGICVVLFALLLGLCIYSAPRAHHLPFGEVNPMNSATYQGMRWIGLLYPPFLLLCTGAALYALCRPVPSGKMMTQEARRRARPYLLASSLVQFTVSVGVALALVFLGYLSYSNSLYGLYSQFLEALNFADLVVCTAISVAVMLLGKAIVSFEIFTGKILPRHGFLRQWRAVVVLAACYSCLLALCLGFELRPIYPILLTTALMSAFLAVLSFHASSDRERAARAIAPFVASHHSTLELLSGQVAPEQPALEEPFHALCEEVLGAARAVLIARGAHASLCGAPRLYPPALPFNAQWTQIVAEMSAPEREVRALPRDCGMNYLVPLGAATTVKSEETGAPLGALLLGPKRDGGLYTLEEIEIARTTGQHLLDSQAGATLAARLVELQRHKLAQVQVLDRGARRTLHDDILPLLHGALLDLSSSNSTKNEAQPDSHNAISLLTEAHKAISNLLREAPTSDSPLARHDFFAALRREAEVELAGAFQGVEWEISQNAREFTSELPPLLADTLFFAAREAVRNAAKYGRGGDNLRTISLSVRALCEENFELDVCDNGIGIGTSKSGAHTSGAGSGSGLALHAALLAIAGGSLRVESAPNDGARVILSLPGTLSGI
ncbi:Histidine kinase-, DNA gyrase B-, and HSP90-like ATPase [Abditibacterium utsteinense]|uniref:histidine kinase n=1 Tax=Abditibacterium utsteinense TaxID=1960156 RepID=A0A2S8SXL2_9BACT|nr:ATP-binding protein [Abditibacterium utsteinense]PQV65542.1 Histidine kinase-, DNA gyrase B-, and HSP90-like ATPase [Abditibacterium utsteinense]